MIQISANSAMKLRTTISLYGVATRHNALYVWNQQLMKIPSREIIANMILQIIRLMQAWLLNKSPISESIFSIWEQSFRVTVSLQNFLLM